MYIYSMFLILLSMSPRYQALLAALGHFQNQIWEAMFSLESRRLDKIHKYEEKKEYLLPFSNV